MICDLRLTRGLKLAALLVSSFIIHHSAFAAIDFINLATTTNGVLQRGFTNFFTANSNLLNASVSAASVGGVTASAINAAIPGLLTNNSSPTFNGVIINPVTVTVAGIVCPARFTLSGTAVADGNYNWEDEDQAWTHYSPLIRLTSSGANWKLGLPDDGNGDAYIITPKLYGTNSLPPTSSLLTWDQDPGHRWNYRGGIQPPDPVFAVPFPSAAATLADLGGLSYTDIGFGFDGAGSVIETATEVYRPMGFSCTIIGWQIVGDQVGSLVFSVEKGTPVSGSITFASITGGYDPFISSSRFAFGNATGWGTLAAGDVLRVVTSFPSALTKCTLVLTVTR